MSAHMMALGQFTFGLDTLAYQDLDRQTAWRHASNSRVGDRPARQFVGAGDDTITLTGVLAPEFKGSAQSLDTLRTMAWDNGLRRVLTGNGEHERARSSDRARAQVRQSGTERERR